MKKLSRKERKKRNIKAHEFRESYKKYMKEHANDSDGLYYNSMHYSKMYNGIG